MENYHIIYITIIWILLIVSLAAATTFACKVLFKKLGNSLPPENSKNQIADSKEQKTVEPEITSAIRTIIIDRFFRSALYRKLYPRLLNKPRRKYKRIKVLLANS